MKAFEEQIQKYVRLPGNEIIIFSKLLEHFIFKHLNPVTAGLCIIDPKKKKVNCLGESITLHLQADGKMTRGLLLCRYLVIKRIK